MKKITLLVLLLLGSSIIINTYASDDLSDLDALLNEEDNSQTEEDNAIWKIILEKVDDDAKKSNSVSLLVTKVWDFVDCKIYYSREDDSENISETWFTIEWEWTKKIIINSLEWGKTYKFIAKAFDNDGNPVEATISDPVIVTIPEQEQTNSEEQEQTNSEEQEQTNSEEQEQTNSEEQEHAAPADNVIYEPIVRVEWNNISITYKPWNDVRKIQISISEDGKVFKPEATIDAKQTKYTIKVNKTGKKYIKIVPIAEDGTIGVCKIWSTEVKFLTANVELKKKAQTNLGKPKTGPEIYLLLILAVVVALGYLYRKN